MDGTETMDDRRLMRYLHGELPREEAERLRERLARDPEAAGRLRELERLWGELELPPAESAPPGFAARVTARAGDERDRRVAPFDPAWARVAAGAVLVAGLAAGASLGVLVGGGPPGSPGLPAAEGDDAPSESIEWSEWAYLEETPSSLAESYWSAVSDTALEEEP